VVLRPTAATKRLAGSCLNRRLTRLHALSTIRAKRAASRDFGVTGDTLTRGWLRDNGDGRRGSCERLRPKRCPTMHTESRAGSDGSSAARAACSCHFSLRLLDNGGAAFWTELLPTNIMAAFYTGLHGFSSR